MTKTKDCLSDIESLNKRYKEDITEKAFFGYPLASLLHAEDKLLAKDSPSVAYLSMEYGLAPNIYLGYEKAKMVAPKQDWQHDLFSNLRDIDYYVPLHVEKRPDMPIYSGGLGVLAGDTVKSAADLGISMVAIGILWHQGYFKQNLWFQYGQVPEPVQWDPEHFPGLVPLKTRVKIDLLQDVVHLKLWKYYVYSRDKSHVVPLILLDSNLPENTHKVSRLTAQLYRSDDAWLKILQRVVLGIGGIQALEALGYNIGCYHLNEGHAAFAFVEKAKGIAAEDQLKALQSQFVYTCHTPVVAGHDRFDLDLAAQVLPGEYMDVLRHHAVEPQQPQSINLTHLAMTVCTRVNAVSQKHGEVMRLQFPQFNEKIQAVTNGVHHSTWMSEPIAALLEEFSKQIGPWREDPTCLKEVTKLKSDGKFREGLWNAHRINKEALCKIFQNWKFREDVLTVCWARRLAGYKRPNMILHDLDRLLKIAKDIGGLQIILSGKAHPNDRVGVGFVNELLNRIDALEGQKDLLRVLMLDNYDTFLGKLLASSVDIWLNNPLPPFEASGTSGMKAIANGVVQLSTLDGWVVEAANHGIGKIFGYKPKPGEIGNEQDFKMDEDAAALYTALDKLSKLYLAARSTGPENPENAWVDMMIHCIAQAGFFNTHRMVREYQSKIWTLPKDHHAKSKAMA